MSSNDRLLLDSTAGLIRLSWGMLTDPAPSPPMRTDQITQLLVGTCTRLCEFPFESSAVGMAIPWGAGEHAILIDRAASRADYEFTIRHELAHVLAGEVGDALFLTASDTMSFSERRADLFAIADLVPAWLVRQLRGRSRPWAYVRLDVQQAFRELAAGWSEERVLDRARLRVALYRECGM